MERNRDVEKEREVKREKDDGRYRRKIEGG